MCAHTIQLTQQYVPNQLSQASSSNSPSRQQLLQAVILRPLSEPQQIYGLHQFYIESAISSLKSRTSELVSELEGVVLHLTGRWCNGGGAPLKNHAHPFLYRHFNFSWPLSSYIYKSLCTCSQISIKRLLYSVLTSLLQCVGYYRGRQYYLYSHRLQTSLH